MEAVPFFKPNRLSVPNAEELRWLVNEIDFSISGRIETYHYNSYLSEAAILLNNALELFEIGYFDAACYSAREAIELSTVGLALTDMPEKDRERLQSSWRSRERFPTQSRLLGTLMRNGHSFSDFPEKMPSLIDRISRCSEKLNKVVHKQGFDYFYKNRCHPVYEYEHGHADLIELFCDCMRDAISIVAVMRLGIDPFPVILTDPECEYRYDESLTKPYSEAMLKDCIGSEIVEQYKTTGIYLSHKRWLLDSFPKKSKAAYDVTAINYIDTNAAADILGDLPLMPLSSVCAALLTIAVPDVHDVYGDDGLTIYFNSRDPLLSAEARSDLFRQVSNAGEDNHAWTTRMIDTEDERRGSIEMRSYLTARSIGDQNLVIESLEPLSEQEISKIDAIASQIEAFLSKLNEGKSEKTDIAKLEVVEKLRGTLTL